jgi:hypothetical protein
MTTDRTGIFFHQMKKLPDVLNRYTIAWRFALIISILHHPHERYRGNY